jgi:Cu+-exporting ATPase
MKEKKTSCGHDKKQPNQKLQAGKDSIYICPMHPEIRKKGPGDCPICGMALEPEIIEIASSENPELIYFRYRFWITLLLSLPIVILEMGGHIFSISHLIDHTVSNWIQLILSGIVFLWGGWPFFERGWQSLKNRSLNMFNLISMGTGVAFIYSSIATIMPSISPASLITIENTIPVYFEAAAAMSLSSVSIIANALRLNIQKI